MAEASVENGTDGINRRVTGEDASSEGCKRAFVVGDVQVPAALESPSNLGVGKAVEAEAGAPVNIGAIVFDGLAEIQALSFTDHPQAT